MFDWTAAAETLYSISKKQIAQFLRGSEKSDVYGFGFFCDPDGFVYLVANTEHYHMSSLRQYQARFGPTAPEVFRWDIGNWKYPGGLFPSSSAEQEAFDHAWQEYQQQLMQMDNERKQEMLEDVCSEVLARLVQEGSLSGIPSLKGFTIQGPDDPQETVLEKKKRFDNVFPGKHA